MESKNKIETDEIINLSELFEALKERKKLIFFSFLISSFISIFYALSLDSYYKSSAILFAVNNSEGSGTASSQFSGLASLAGISLANSSEDKGVLAVEIIRSREFVKTLIKEEDILKGILASERYDRNTKQLFYNDSIYDEDRNIWYSEGEVKKNYKPSHIQAHEEYFKNLFVKKDRQTNLITISYEHLSPIFAKNLLDLIIYEANELSRSRDRNETIEAMRYLENKLEITKIESLRNAIISIYSSEMQKLALINVREEYLLKKIDSPYVPVLKSRPNRPLICIMGAILGTLIAMSYSLFSFYRKK